MSIDQNRAFHYAVLASLVLHATLLFVVKQPQRPSAREPEPPLVARLVEPPAPAAVVPPVAQTEPVTKPEPPLAEPVRKPRPRPRAKPVAPKPEPEVPAAAPEPAPIAEAAPEPQPAPAPPFVAPAAPAPAPAAAPPVTARVDPVPDAGSLAQYRLKLISAARNYKRYPRLAIDNQWEGDVVVRMEVGPSGRLATLIVQSSSGHAVLDEQALEMFRKAAAVVEVTPALRGKEFALELRAIYNLRDRDSG